MTMYEEHIRRCGGVEHLLVVARRPVWRVVLRRIAPRLEKAGVRYKVVGGASVALHGVPAPVRDVDLETDAAGAYRFPGTVRRPRGRARSPA